MESPSQGQARRVFLETYGCQMNLHDSEKLTNLLYHAGMQPAADLDSADLLVINTCSITSLLLQTTPPKISLSLLAFLINLSAYS